MKISTLIIFLFISCTCISQSFDTAMYSIRVESSVAINKFFANNSTWRGGDGASSIDLGNGKILWLFGDSFICNDSSGSRKKSILIRNSVAIQDGYDLKTASLKFYWNKTNKEARAIFHQDDSTWFWPGHGIMIKDKLLIFLMKEHAIKTGLGFETIGWVAVLISNPKEDPSKWKIKYINGPNTYGTVAGSAAVLKDDNYIYAYGAVEPGNHDVYLLRWKIKDAYAGNLNKPEWWLNDSWSKRKNINTKPQLLFNGATEYSVHYDAELKKYIQVQSFGFGESKIALRISNSLQGPWTEPYMIYTPDYTGIKKPFMYSAKAHPELVGNGIYVTYNINSFDFDELLDNQSIYFPEFVLIKIIKKASVK